MVSAVNSLSTPRLQLSERVVPFTVHLAGVLIGSLPFLAVGWLAHQALYLSDTNARVVAQVLVAVQAARFESIILSYPPAPSLLVLAAPSVLTLIIISSLVGGALVWTLMRQLALTRLHILVRILLLFAFVVMPHTLYMATQDFAAMLALLLFLLAWVNFNHFTRAGITWNGFAAGLLLGFAFFANIYSLIYAVIFMLATPFFMGSNRPAQERWPAAITAMVVVIFPAAIAFFMWSYLNWIFNGTFFNFAAGALANPAFGQPAFYSAGLVASVESVVSDLIHQPLYLAVGVIVLLVSPKRLLAYLSPVFVVAVARVAGLHYASTFAMLTLSVVAFAAIPRRASPWWGIVLVAVALLQVYLTFTTFPDERWQQAVIGQTSTADQTEMEIATQLRQAAEGSIMIDDRYSYRLIARAGTAAPFVTPQDARYELAAFYPAGYVPYLLLHIDDRLDQRFGSRVPIEFVFDRAWAGWQLYRRLDAPPLLVLP